MTCPRCELAPRRGRWRVLCFVLAGALALIGTVHAVSAGNGGNVARARASTGVIRVNVGEDGFSPSSVTVEPGDPVQLEFTRTTEETCASTVVFPELGLTRDLSINTPVRVPVVVDRQRTLSFQCGVGDHRSAVVIQ